jgi:hypothetical protein
MTGALPTGLENCYQSLEEHRSALFFRAERPIVKTQICIKFPFTKDNLPDGIISHQEKKLFIYKSQGFGQDGNTVRVSTTPVTVLMQSLPFSAMFFVRRN